jgi:hypothetical protein
MDFSSENLHVRDTIGINTDFSSQNRTFQAGTLNLIAMETSKL